MPWRVNEGKRDSFNGSKSSREGTVVDWLSRFDLWIEFWHWWVLAGLLLVLELTTRVFFFLWLGFAAAAVGFLLLVFPGIPGLPQLAVFAILSLIAVAAWRRHRAAHPGELAEPGPAPRRDLTFALDNPIVGGSGCTQLEGASWRLSGPDLPAGTRVRVVGVEGDTVVVEAVDGS
jgi:membrane protein implicated in regulation of membrane protease activity